MRLKTVLFLLAGLSGSLPVMAAPVETLFVASPLTAEGSFTAGVEGPAVDAAGNIYAANFGRQQTIGVVTSQGVARALLALPGASVPNG